MTVVKLMKLLFIFVVTALVSNHAPAQGAYFHRIQLMYGISLEVPSHWVVLSKATRKNIGAAGEAIMDNAGIVGRQGRQKKSLLAMNAVPNPTGAMIRVSVTSPPDYTQADLAAATIHDLKDIGVGLLSMFRKLEASGGPKVIEMQSVRIDRVNNFRALVMPYIRAGFNEASPWQVTQYKIPVSNKLIEITLSYRKSDSVVWRPILERVKRSLRF